VSNLEDRIRRLEEKLARLDMPDLQEVTEATSRIASRAASRLHRDPSPDSYAGQDNDKAIVRKWVKMAGVNLDAERAYQKLEAIGEFYVGG
jgi:hypothetical protein